MESTNRNVSADDEQPVIRFRQLTPIGEDGAGRYLVGFDEGSGERVGIVVARPTAAASADAAQAQALARVGAAQRAGTSASGGIAQVRAVGRTAGGHPFVVSGIGEGMLLSEFDELEVPEAVEVLADAAAILSVAHARGIAHGSVATHTIFLTADGAVQLHGFGIAAPSNLASSRAMAGVAREDVRALARVGRTILNSGPGRPIPRSVAALIARAESQESPMTAEAFAEGLARAAGGDVGGPDDDDAAAIPAASAYDSSRWALRRRGAVRLAGAIAAVVLLFVLFGDTVGRALDNNPLGAPAPPAVVERREAAGAMAPDESSGVRGAAPGPLPVEQGGADRPVAVAPGAPDETAGTGRGERVRPDERAPRREPVEPEAAIPAPPPSVIEGEFATIPAGTPISLIAGERVCTNTHRAGARFPAKVERSIAGSGGEAIPTGSDASMVVTSVTRGADATDALRVGLAVLHFVVDGVAYPVDAAITSARVEPARGSSGAEDAGAVAGGAVAGAILGRILGRDTRSAVIGAAAGAAVGTIIAMGTGEQAGCIPAGGVIGIRLESPLRMPVA
jgi:hypothetical protein